VAQEARVALEDLEGRHVEPQPERLGCPAALEDQEAHRRDRVTQQQERLGCLVALVAPEGQADLEGLHVGPQLERLACRVVQGDQEVLGDLVDLMVDLVAKAV
jgi:hypothetical protein